MQRDRVVPYGPHAPRDVGSNADRATDFTNEIDTHFGNLRKVDPAITRFSKHHRVQTSALGSIRTFGRSRKPVRRPHHADGRPCTFNRVAYQATV